MSYSFSDFSSTTEAGGSISAASPSVTPSENIWLEFDTALDRKRDELEAALLRFLDEDRDIHVRP
jgi:hypothetical protein